MCVSVHACFQAAALALENLHGGWGHEGKIKDMIYITGRRSITAGTLCLTSWPANLRF